METGNLPSWPGASVVYSRCYRILEELQHKAYNPKKRSWGYWPTQDAIALIEALNKGNEEYLKAAIYQYNTLGYLP